MSGLVRNPEDLFSSNKAQISFYSCLICLMMILMVLILLVKIYWCARYLLIFKAFC